MSKNNYNNFWRNKKKYINYLIILLLLFFAIVIQVFVTEFPLSNDELVETKESYCSNNCKLACKSKNTELVSYENAGYACYCSCSDNTQARFGIDDLK
jgi:hypothetical protein